MAVVAGVAFLPFVRGILSGASLYFRDLALYFLPLRRLALDGLRNGEIRFWNPYVHEGVPLTLPSVGYPADLLQLLRPDEVGISLVLALHVPLAAAGFYALGRRELDVPPVAAAGSALVYALGGFLLSTVNLYVVLQAAAWAPLVVLTVARVTRTGLGALPGASLAVAVALSTTGVEVVGQALMMGVLLGVSWDKSIGRRLGGAAAAVGLGLVLAAPVLLLVASQVEGSARSQGFSTDVVLAHSIHPFTLVQVVVGGLYGNLSNLAGEWWGQNFFPRGFPYILSLYVGAAALAVAAVGAWEGRDGHRARRRTVALLAIGLAIGLGRWAGLGVLVEALPAASSFRYPVKAFFTVHFALALLVAYGLARLADDVPRHWWRRLAASGTALGAVLVTVPLLPRLAPDGMRAFASAFFPPGTTPAAQETFLSRVLTDAAVGGVLALAVAATAVLALRGSVPSFRAAGLVAALLAADLLRTGSGLNPMVDRAFFQPSPDLSAVLEPLGRGRVFSCSFDSSRSYREGRLARGDDHEAWTFAVALETLTPAFNVPLRVPTALSPDLTMLVPEDRVATPNEATCRNLDGLLPRLRRAAVTTVLSVDPLRHAELVLRGTLRPARTEPVGVHVYELQEPAGRFSLPVVLLHESTDHLELEVQADAPGDLLVRDGWAPGWVARVDGRGVDLGQVDGRHRRVPVPAGRSVVSLDYRPPGLPLGLGLTTFGLVILVGLEVARRRRDRRGTRGSHPTV